MQINVMPWLDGGVGAAAGRAAARARAASPSRWPCCRSLPLVWNVGQLARFRGGDARRSRPWRRSSSASRRTRRCSSTGASSRSRCGSTRCGAAPGTGTASPSRRDDPKFKWIAIDAGAIRHPDWTAEQHAEVAQARHRPGPRPRLSRRHLRRLDLEARPSLARPARRPVGRRADARRRSTTDAARQLRRREPALQRSRRPAAYYELRRDASSDRARSA